jgi:DNA-binding GntR family transcriptional regulator
VPGLRDRIASGELRPGDLLPTAAKLAVQHGVQVKTVRRATDVLRAEGLIATRYMGSSGTRLVVLAQTVSSEAVAV